MSGKNIFAASAGELKYLRSLVMASLLAAIYAVSYSPFAGNFVLVPGVIEIRFGFLALAVAGMLFGPVVAAITAVIGDVAGTILFYGGSFFWGFTFSWMLQGFVFGLFFYKNRTSMPRIIVSMLFNTSVINLLLTTKWQQMMGIGTFEALFFKRLLQNAIMLPINTMALTMVLKGCRSALDRLEHHGLAEARK